MWSFHRQQLLEARSFETGALLVTARGLGIHHLLFHLLCTSASSRTEEGACPLTLVLNTTQRYTAAILPAMTLHRPSIYNDLPSPLFHHIVGEMPIEKRIQLYQTGGVLFISPRILVVDLLLHRVPLIAEIFVDRAHTISEYSILSLCLQLARQQFRECNITALCDRPEMLVTGFNRLEKVLKWLQVRHVRLWPRFDVDALRAFNELEEEGTEKTEKLANDIPPAVRVHELRVPMNEQRSVIQLALLDSLLSTLRTLKRQCPALFEQGDQILDTHALLLPAFDETLSRQLRALWPSLTNRIRDLYFELLLHRQLTLSLQTQTLLQWRNELLALRKAAIQLAEREMILNTPQQKQGANSWWLSDACEKLVQVTLTANENIPKTWEIVKQLLETELKEKDRILILVETPLMASSLRSYLSGKFSSNNNVAVQNNSLPVNANTNSGKKQSRREKIRERLNANETVPIQETQSLATEEDDLFVDILLECDHFGLVHEHFVMIESIFNMKQFHETALLEQWKPAALISLCMDLSLIRQIEVFCASQREIHLTLAPLDVYFVLFAESLHEHAYLMSVRREKEALEQLIQSQATLGALLLNETSVALIETDANETSRIIVDMREFQSALPSRLYHSRIEIIPKMLLTGDYVLAPQVLVERKTLADLEQSLSNGRLYQQYQQMLRCTSTPLLLIELDEQKPPSWQMVHSSAFQKLVLLLIHCPQFRLLWSFHGRMSVDYFLDLKQSHGEPDPAVVEEESLEQQHHSGFMALQKLPGMKYETAHVKRHYTNLLDFICSTREKLELHLGMTHGAQLFQFMNHSYLHHEK